MSQFGFEPTAGEDRQCLSGSHHPALAVEQGAQSVVHAADRRCLTAPTVTSVVQIRANCGQRQNCAHSSTPVSVHSCTKFPACRRADMHARATGS
ncbi:hypothetical protein JDM601_3130 [Mycolicibacter sinensis]|uniref:Uncharacterized protein n=1 Tax=Mycolicibacter sinensis (strain JDM601) TaxID=875328 RepID=F5Z314_MYCSD|nr:hypothetical protein JDM601_3130 [Mycolicibacter sinensis]